jgi:hypothetical protein
MEWRLRDVVVNNDGEVRVRVKGIKSNNNSEGAVVGCGN